VATEGELFVVMEYLPGESAASLMRRLHMQGESLDFPLAAHVAAENGRHTSRKKSWFFRD